jgi:SAM-dependent methyltransferase
MASIFHKIKRKLLSGQVSISRRGSDPEKLSATQQQFIHWNAQRLGISQEDSTQRYFASWRAVKGGHRRSDFRDFSHMSHDLYQVFFNDNESEIYSAYAFHGPMHFLRMLSYSDPVWTEQDPVIQHLSTYSTVDIIDYGCGLAQRSRALADYLSAKGIRVSLTLVDIPTIRKEFLLWMGVENKIKTIFIESTEQSPVPELPAADICIATEFFEHVYDPLPYFRNIDKALRKNALLVTNIEDHKKEFMHVSPDLASLRSAVKALNYDELEPRQLFRK